MNYEYIRSRVYGAVENIITAEEILEMIDNYVEEIADTNYSYGYDDGFASASKSGGFKFSE